MKRHLIAVLVCATTFGSSAVMAQNIGNPTQTLDVTDGSDFFGDTFAADNGGATFTDRFNFTVSGAEPLNLAAVVATNALSGGTGLGITGLSLYDVGGGAVVTSGTSQSSGALDVWTLTSNNLTAGNYYLQVSGNVVSDESASFGGAVSLVPVPEPETYGMMLGGLGILACLARRRRGAGRA